MVDASVNAEPRKTRFRATISFEYEAAITEKSYGTTDPDEAARIDQQQLAQDPTPFFGFVPEWTATVQVL